MGPESEGAHLFQRDVEDAHVGRVVDKPVPEAQIQDELTDPKAFPKAQIQGELTDPKPVLEAQIQDELTDPNPYMVKIAHCITESIHYVEDYKSQWDLPIQHVDSMVLRRVHWITEVVHPIEDYRFIMSLDDQVNSVQMWTAAGAEDGPCETDL